MREEQAWAAGFFDGEGCTSIWRTHHRRPHIGLTIGQTDRRVLDRFAAAVGEGKVYGPYVSKNPNHQPAYRYAAYGPQAKRAMDVIWEFLGEAKREQFAKAAAQILDERGGLPAHELGADTCRRGHQDWYIKSNGIRTCRPCRAATKRAWRARRAANA